MGLRRNIDIHEGERSHHTTERSLYPYQSGSHALTPVATHSPRTQAKVRSSPKDWNETVEDFYIFSTIRTWIELATKKANSFSVQTCECPSCQSAFNESASRVALEHFITTSNEYWWDKQLSVTEKKTQAALFEIRNDRTYTSPPAEMAKKLKMLKEQGEFIRSLKEGTERPYTTDIPSPEELLPQFQTLRLEQEWTKAMEKNEMVRKQAELAQQQEESAREEEELARRYKTSPQPTLILDTDIEEGLVTIFFDDQQSNGNNWPTTVIRRSPESSHGHGPGRVMIAASLPPTNSAAADANNGIYSGVRGIGAPTTISPAVSKLEAAEQATYMPAGLIPQVVQQMASIHIKERPVIRRPSKSGNDQGKVERRGKVFQSPSSQRQITVLPSYPTIPPAQSPRKAPVRSSGSLRRARSRTDSARTVSPTTNKPLPMLPPVRAVISPVMGAVIVDPNPSKISAGANEKWLNVLTLTLAKMDELWSALYIKLADSIVDEYDDVVDDLKVISQDPLTRAAKSPSGGKACFRDLRKLHASRALVNLALRTYKHEFTPPSS